MMPSELLHTSGSGLIMYMFESLRDQMGGGKDRDLIDKQHIQISSLIKRQSECDFSLGSIRNGVIDEQNVSLQNKREICSNYCVLHIQQMEVMF
jgi:hypothetical protein